MISYIDDHRGRFWGRAHLRTLQVAPSTYYAAKKRPPSAHQVGDETLKPEIKKVFQENFRVYGARKIWKQLHREGQPVARCTVERLMADLGLEGRRRGRKRRTTIPADVLSRPADLVDSHFVASAPNLLWIADTFPMAGNCPVLHLGGSFTDHHHVPDLAFGRRRSSLGTGGWLFRCVDNATAPYAASLCPG